MPGFETKVLRLLEGGYYRKAGLVRATGLDGVWAKTQNIETAWRQGQRSSMVGDIFERAFWSGGGRWIVTGIGFKELPR